MSDRSVRNSISDSAGIKGEQASQFARHSEMDSQKRKTEDVQESQPDAKKQALEMFTDDSGDETTDQKRERFYHRFKFSTGMPVGTSLDVTLTDDPICLEGIGVRRYNAQKALWPPHKQYGIACITFSTDKSQFKNLFLTDVDSFQRLFGDPAKLVEVVRGKADQVANEWNTKYGNQVSRKRFEVTRSIKVNEARCGGDLGSDLRSKFVLQLNSWKFTSQALKKDGPSTITPSDMVVYLKIKTNASVSQQVAEMSPGPDGMKHLKSGVYIPFEEFIALAESEKTAAAVKAASAFVKSVDDRDSAGTHQE